MKNEIEQMKTLAAGILRSVLAASPEHNGTFRLVVLMAVRNRGNLAEKSAGQHGCKRGTAALTAMPQRIRPSTASRVCCAGLAPALDPAPGRQFSCPDFRWRQISAVFDRH
ncbi:hypothetical protein [Candidatus Accumulibacter vicinus]|uniref:Uncharacterized protein n=1 Tax=Candidatus Accumulibacter vicinus TaxID=2954382 RepID=A0A084Y3J1_9PROT|nr:hypothetical protein [Candidatus Accumulibacter vicinus]KFB69285.1 MAG: hypothetical protein CAPSK01_001030 [Candidatus Accumulibacter vicinus]